MQRLWFAATTSRCERPDGLESSRRPRFRCGFASRGSPCCCSAAPGNASRSTCAASRTSRPRSEEHTSELQSLAYLVCRLLLEKKKNKQTSHASTADSVNS